MGVVEVCGYPHFASPTEAGHCMIQTGRTDRVTILGADGHVTAHARFATARFSFLLRPGRYTSIAWNDGSGPWKLRFTAVASRETHANVVIPAM
ncbi:MAG: hypothetical protein JO120_01860 [Solirubrobacterales bacterium]|nr:hypothetical protein [Solirubrobacterales bacterium]